MSRFPFPSLRFRLIFLVLLIAIPAMGLIFYSGLKQRDHARLRALNDALAMAKDVSLVHERIIENARQTLFTLSQMPQVRHRDAAACSGIFVNLLKQSKGHTNFGAAKPDGNVFASAHPITQPINFADRPWFQRVARTHAFVISEYVIGRITGKPIVTLAYPVLDEGGQLKAVLFTGLDLGWLNQFVMKGALTKGTSVSIIDSTGTTLLRYPEPEKFVGKNVPEAIFKAILDKREGVIETAGLDGVVRLFGFTTFGQVPGAIYASVGIPRETAFAEADSAMSRNLMWLGLITALSLLAAWLVGEFSIMDPLNRLLGATQQLSQGKLTARTGLSHEAGEIGQLAHAFDQMAESLEGQTTQLRQAEAKYRQLVEQIPAITYTAALDESGSTLYVSPQIEAILGFSQAEWMADSQLWSSRLHPDDRERVLAEYAQASNTGQPFLSEYRLMAFDESPRWVRDESIVVRDDAGNPLFLQGIIFDITEQKKAGAELLRQYALLDGINKVLKEVLVCRTEEELGHRYLAVAEGLTQSKFGFICELNHAGLFDTIAISDPGWEACRIPKASAIRLLNNLEIRGIRGRVIKEERSMIFNDPESHPDWLNPPENHPTITRFLGIPLKHGNTTIGMVGLANKESEYDLYDQKDVETLSTIFMEALMSERTEHAFTESEKRYREVVENAADIIYTTDVNGNFTYANPAAERASGYSLEELRQLNYKELIVPEHYDRVSKVYIDQIRQKSQVSYVEFPFASKSGETKWFAQNASLVTENGKIEGFHIIARDITDRERAEEALKESEKKYRDLVENALIGVYRTNLKGEFLYANEALLRILEFESLQDLMQRGIVGTYKNPRDRKRLIERLNEGGRVGNFELEFLTRTGKVKNVLLSASLDGEILSGMIMDMTDSKMAQEALRESEHRYRTLINTAKDVIFTLSSEGTISTLNVAFEEMTGWSSSDWLNKSFLPLVHPDDTPLAKKMYGIALKREETPIFELRILTRGGEYIFGEFVLVPLSEGGEADAILGIARDVTERKRKEEETASLEEQLRQSQKMESIGHLAGGVAHDFNNLLTIIKGYSQLSLTELKDSDPLKGSIDEIQKAADKAAALTRQLLAFSRRQVMEVKVLDLHTVLKDLDKMLRRMIGEDIELVTLMSEDLGRIKADPGQIEQVVLNLSVNARDAMPFGGKLTIETANVELDGSYARTHVAVKPGRYVMLSLSDTGVGMTPEVKDRIFEPFFTTKEKGKGTGLGLSTVYGIVKQSGGNIWVYSELGQGTTFKVYFPRVDEPASELGAKVKVEGIPPGNETILVVEDDDGVRKLAVRILEKQGYTVLEARKGDEAINACIERKDPIHLVLTDVVMPEMSGRKFVENLSLLQRDFKVLYMSGYTDNAIVHHGVLDEGVEFVQKPFSFEGLARKVREVLDKSRDFKKGQS